jgi:hypothetical protein
MMPEIFQNNLSKSEIAEAIRLGVRDAFREGIMAADIEEKIREGVEDAFPMGHEIGKIIDNAVYSAMRMNRGDIECRK